MLLLLLLWLSNELTVLNVVDFVLLFGGGVDAWLEFIYDNLVLFIHFYMFLQMVERCLIEINLLCAFYVLGMYFNISVNNIMISDLKATKI